ncbi:hypothetical protein VN1227_07480 [Helicobacter pylori]|nr:hypothetical protein VN1227_07480 [Helicobacter pylori]
MGISKKKKIKPSPTNKRVQKKESSKKREFKKKRVQKKEGSKKRGFKKESLKEIP